MRNHVVSWVWLLIVEMSEWGHVSCTKIERNEWVSIIDCIQIFSIQVLKNIMFDDSCLGLSCVSCSSCWNVGCWSKSENVLIFLVLKCVRIYINEPIVVSQTGFSGFIPWFWWRMNYKLIEVFFNGFSCVYILKDSPFFSFIIFHDFLQFPTKMNFNISLSTFL